MTKIKNWEVLVVDVRYVRGYILDVYFSDGTHREISFDGMFDSIDVFKQVEVAGWALIWESGEGCRILPSVSLYAVANPDKRQPKSISEKYATPKKK